MEKDVDAVADDEMIEPLRNSVIASESKNSSEGTRASECQHMLHSVERKVESGLVEEREKKSKQLQEPSSIILRSILLMYSIIRFLDCFNLMLL